MKINVLDNGYVKLIEAYGTGIEGVGNDVFSQDNQSRNLDNDYEVGIIEAARQSTQANFRGWEIWYCNTCRCSFSDKWKHYNNLGKICESVWSNDEKLLAFMSNNNHSTPFEFAGMVIEVKLPIFVAREWLRHRTQSYNEMSARYAPLPNENYVPTEERLFLTQVKNKQAQGIDGTKLIKDNAEQWLYNLTWIYGEIEKIYQEGLKFGISKEVARILLPVGRYTQMRASANLRNWLGFCALRSTKSNPNAQWEIRQFADAVEEILSKTFPKTFQLFDSLRSK